MMTALPKISAKSALAEAIGYALNHWTALTRYLNDGRVVIDPSPVECALCPVALSRKNYLFAGSDAGGESAAAICSTIATAKLNDVEPESCLRGVVARIADHKINRIEELLPWNWAVEGNQATAA
jgi:transposase